MKVQLSPIGDDDIPGVAAYLTAALNDRVSPQSWSTAMRTAWVDDAPNHGFQLTADGAVVGAYLAFYSKRVIDGVERRICNLGAWSVEPEHRFQGVRLFQAMLRQQGYTFTDLSPSGNVVDLNQRSGFSFLQATTFLFPNLPWPTVPGRVRITADGDRIRAALTGPAAVVFEDHRQAPAANHLLLSRGDRHCHVVFRRDRRKNLPLFGSLLHASDPDLLRSSMRPLTRYLLTRERLLATLVDTRIHAGAPRSWAFDLGPSRRKMYRSSELDPAQIDYLYSELVLVPW